MGIDINAVKICKMEESEINFPTDEEENRETFVLDGFERTLQPNEHIKLVWNDEKFELENAEYFNTHVSMAYSSYNRFRSELSLATIGKADNEVYGIAVDLKDGEPYPHPMYHVVFFADNEGYIGPQAVKAVSEYFQKNKSEIYEKIDESFRVKLDEFVKIFKEADDCYPHGFVEYG